jgi:hypothetical protein
MPPNTYDLAMLFARAANRPPILSDTTDWCAFPPNARQPRQLDGLALSDSINAGWPGSWQFVVIDGRVEYGEE